jgi:hypothetical protein
VDNHLDPRLKYFRFIPEFGTGEGIPLVPSRNRAEKGRLPDSLSKAIPEISVFFFDALYRRS